MGRMAPLPSDLADGLARAGRARAGRGDLVAVGPGRSARRTPACAPGRRRAGRQTLRAARTRRPTGERARRLRLPRPDREGPAAAPPRGDAGAAAPPGLDGRQDPLAARADRRRRGPRQDDPPRRLEPADQGPRALVPARRDRPRLGRLRQPRRGGRARDRPGVRPQHHVAHPRAGGGHGRPGGDRAHAPHRDPGLGDRRHGPPPRRLPGGRRRSRDPRDRPRAARARSRAARRS